MKKLLGSLALLCLLPVSVAWGGKIYKCQTDGGPAVYTDQPCKGKYGDPIGEPKEMDEKDGKNPVTVIPATHVKPAPPLSKPAAESSQEAGGTTAKGAADPNSRASQPTIPGQSATPAKEAPKTSTGTGKHARLEKRTANTADKPKSSGVRTSSDLVKNP